MTLIALPGSQKHAIAVPRRLTKVSLANARSTLRSLGSPMKARRFALSVVEAPAWNRRTLPSIRQGLDDERISRCPMVPTPRQQSYADGIPARHEAVAVVLNLVNPVGAGRLGMGGKVR